MEEDETLKQDESLLWRTGLMRMFFTFSLDTTSSAKESEAQS